MKMPRWMMSLLLAVAVGVEAQGQVFPGESWDARLPAEVGMDSALLEQFGSSIGGDGAIVRGGYLIKTWGDPAAQGDWASAMKPVISTMLFFAMQSGLITTVNAPVQPIVQQVFGRSLIAKDQPMTWLHLANMMSGYARAERAGAAWAYNDYGIALYGDLLFKGVFGDAESNVVARYLAPLQFQDGPIIGAGRLGHEVVASPRDFARVGWFWMNQGSWNGTQLLSKAYFDAFVRATVPVNKPVSAAPGSDYLGVGSVGGGSSQYVVGPGFYGFNFWFNSMAGSSGRLLPDAPADAYMAAGEGNRYVMLMIPSLQLVAAARGYWGGFFEPNNSTGAMNRIVKFLVQAASPTPPDFDLPFTAIIPGPHDYDGNGRADPAVFWASGGNWYIRNGTNGQMLTGAPVNFGWSATIPVPSDYDGDGRTDLAVYWPDAGNWYIRKSSDGLLLGGGPIQWGWSAVVPTPADFDGDGKADLAVFLPNGGNWYIRKSSDGQLLNGAPIQWGWNEVEALPSDYDGDGKADVAVYLERSGTWYIRKSSDGQMLSGAPIQWGWQDVIPVPADYDGDGKTDIAVYWPSGGLWYVRQSSDGQMLTGAPIQWGWDQGQPVPADYDGDGKADIAVYWQQAGAWYIRKSSDGQMLGGAPIQWGWSQADPVP